MLVDILTDGGFVLTPIELIRWISIERLLKRLTDIPHLLIALHERAAGATTTDDEAARQTTVETTRTRYAKSDVVREYALRVADGVCQGCMKEAPFIGNDDEPYLEVHHLYRRSDDGPDHPDNVIALCPNCHRRVHHGKDGGEFNQELISRAENIEGHSDP